MSFTHSCAHAHLIPIFPGSQRVPWELHCSQQKLLHGKGGGFIMKDLLAFPWGEAGNDSVPALGTLRAQGKALGSIPPHFGAASPFFQCNFSGWQSHAVWEGEKQIFGHLEGFQLIYLFLISLFREDSWSQGQIGECKVWTQPRGFEFPVATSIEWDLMDATKIFGVSVALSERTGWKHFIFKYL